MRAQQAGAIVSTLATRMSFLVVAWLVLDTTSSVGWTVPVVSVQAATYLAGWRWGGWLTSRMSPARLVLGADLLATVLLSAVAFTYNAMAPLLVIIALVGVARAMSDHTRGEGASASVSTADSDELPAPSREWLVTTVTVLGGALLGLVVVLLGAVGGLWLTAVACALAAAIAVWSSPSTGAATQLPAADLAALVPAQPVAPALPGDPAAPGEAPEAATVLPARAELLRHPVLRVVTMALFGVTVLGTAGAVALLGILQREVFTDQIAGFAAGAFAVAAIGAGAVFTAQAYHPTRWTALTLGYLAGGGTLLLVRGMPAIMLLLFAAPVLAGIALASVTPTTAMVVADRVAPAARDRVGDVMVALTHAALVLGAAAGAWLSLNTSVVVAIIVAALLYLGVTMVPFILHRAWREVMPEQPPPGVRSRSAEKLRARMSVTLAYADGQWLVEVRKGRELLGSRHAVNSADALRTLALLDVPTVHDGIGRVLTIDQDEAARQVQRARTELSELEAKLSGLQEMVDLSDNHKPA